jgi:hypothetical protein
MTVLGESGVRGAVSYGWSSHDHVERAGKWLSESCGSEANWAAWRVAPRLTSSPGAPPFYFTLVLRIIAKIQELPAPRCSLP